MKALLLIATLLFYTQEVGSKHFDISEYQTISIDYSIELMNDVANYYGQSYELIKYVFDICGAFYLDPLLLIALIRIESSFIADAVSKSGAVGYCQIKPIVVLDIKSNLDRYKHDENIMIGAIFLAKLISRYDNDIRKALVHYNAGTQKKLQAKGNIYADKVINEYENIALIRESYNNKQTLYSKH